MGQGRPSFDDSGAGGRGFRRGGRGSRRGGRFAQGPRKGDKHLSAEEKKERLDKDLDTYWEKGGFKEHGKLRRI